MSKRTQQSTKQMINALHRVMKDHAEKEAALYAKIVGLQVAGHFDNFSKSLQESFQNRPKYNIYCGQV